jgi:hydrogenase maturation protease
VLDASSPRIVAIEPADGAIAIEELRSRGRGREVGEIAARVAAAPPRGCHVFATERPGVELIELLSGRGATILLDAVRSGAAAGTIHDLPLDDLPPPRPAVSSHGIGIAEAVALARALGYRPHGRFIGIEARPPEMRTDDPLGADVAAAIGVAVQRVRSWIERYREPCV